MSDVVISAGPFTMTARFEAAAPLTCAAIRTILPLEKQLIHVRWSGEATWIPLGDLAPDNRLMAATVRLDDGSVDVDAVRPLFEMRAPDGQPRHFYDVAGNGQRFMVIVPDEGESTPLTLVNNWPTLVKNGR